MMGRASPPPVRLMLFLSWVLLVVVGVVLVVAFLVVLVVDGVPACWGLRSGTVSLGRTVSLVVGGLKFVEIRRNSFGGNQ